MEQKPFAQAAGSALLLLAFVSAENLHSAEGQPHLITLWLLELGFTLFLARTLLAIQPVGGWLRARHAILRALSVAALALLIFASPVPAAFLALGALLFFGGILTAEFFDDAARWVARPRAFSRRPMAFGILLLVGVLAISLVHYIFAQGAFMVWGDTPMTSAFGAATLGLHAAAAVIFLLVVFAFFRKGREALPRRALYALALLYMLTWFIGYSTQDALNLKEAKALPLLAVGIALVEFFEILFEAPERVAAGGRALERDALWDLFLTIAFGILLALTMFDLGGQSVMGAIFSMKAFGWLGLLAGALIVPLSRWWRGSRKSEATAADPPAPVTP